MKSPSERAITHGPRTVRSLAIVTLTIAFVQDLPPIGTALVVALVVISLGAHEAAHGWAALKCGDTTARDLGRITLNPLPHIDIFMTIVLPAICLLTSGFLIGGAKPVPVSYYNLRSPLRDMALVALAGPLSNFLLAALFLLANKLLVFELGIWDPAALGPRIVLSAMYFNLFLAAFNLLPIPPLDGSRVMAWLLPRGLREPYQSLERFGLIIVLVFVLWIPGASALVGETVDWMYSGIRAMVTLGGTW
jgi:Zn-dependent protease